MNEEPNDSANTGGKTMGIIFGIIAAIVAASKGFASLRWAFAFGLVGLVVVSCLPSAKSQELDDGERTRRIAKADKVGANMVGWWVGFNAVVFIAIIAFSQ